MYASQLPVPEGQVIADDWIFSLAGYKEYTCLSNSSIINASKSTPSCTQPDCNCRQKTLNKLSTHHKLVRSTSTMARSDTFFNILGLSLLTDVEQRKSICYVAFVTLVTVALWAKLQRIAPAIALAMQVTKISIAGQFVSSYRF